ncbi:ImuA family protein [Parapedobacter sp. DT-150]|uniref:ImuA family protein n=1 Tax=Parapedobacter sp. DT-150 TaxID=3396162 RepID=UPI003F19AC0C
MEYSDQMAALSNKKSEIISQLQKRILRWQGYRASASPGDRVGLGPVEEAFPNGVFPIGRVHEFIMASPEQTAASSGFVGGLLSTLMRAGGICLWISPSTTLFPPAINTFGVAPDRIIFITMRRENDIRWALEEALKCTGLAAVVAELREMDFVQSRRLQLAVEKTQVTGFVLRSNPRKVGATACAARWRIQPLPSELEPGLPGVGFPKWEVQLLTVRNGNPGTWRMEWSGGRFTPVVSAPPAIALPEQNRQTGS